MKTIPKICPICNTQFDAPLREVNRGNAKVCSRKCSRIKANMANIKNHAPNVTCAFCKKDFYISPSKFKNSRSGLYFCCRKHKDLAQRIGGIEQIQPPHYGTSKRRIDYRYIAFEKKPKICEVCSYSTYTEILQVHHRDYNRENNTIENLQILCPNCHMTHHFLTKTGFWASRS